MTVKVEPGTHLTVGSLTVQGTLLAEGTAENPVRFTGSKEKGVGEWKAIFFKPGSGASVLDHVELANGGGMDSNSFTYNNGSVQIEASSPRITNSTIRDSGGYGIRIPEGGSPEIAGNAFINAAVAHNPIFYIAGSGKSGEINIHDNYIEGGKEGIQIEIFSGSTVNAKVLSGNTIVGTESTGILFSGPDIPGNITENTLIANASNYIQVGGTVAHSSTWNDGGSRVLLSGVTVPAGVTLKISPGVHLLQPTMTVQGTLLAEGTAENPVRFTGKYEAKVGEWKAIFFKPGSGASVLDHVELANGGGIDSGYSQYNNGSVQIEASSPRITNSTIRDSGGYGIRIPEGGAPEIADNVFINAGVARNVIWYVAGTGKSGEINIHGNYIEGGKQGIQIETFSGSTVTAKVLAGNSVVGTEGTGLSYSGDDVPGNITENTLIGNASNYILVSGTVAQSSTWNDGGTRVRLIGVTIPTGVTLKIAHGVHLLRPAFTVKGTLNVEGTAEDLVRLTGFNENLAGEWGGIKFEKGSNGSIEYAELANGGNGSGAIEIKATNPTIKNSLFRKNASYAIKVLESGSPTIERNLFRANSYGVFYNGTGTLAAKNNDWGCGSGPKPAGCGDTASANVDWKPAVQLPEPSGHCRGEDSQCGEGADPVSLATGQLAYAHRDLVLSNKSAVPLAFSRAYSSGSSADTGLGPGWSQTGLANVSELPSGGVLVVRQDGRQDLYGNSEGSYHAPSGVTDMLTKVEGKFRLTTLRGTVYSFDASGRIASITDDHGLKTTYGYNASGRLATITDPSAQTLTFSYDSSNHITAVKDSTGREVKYGYTTAGDLGTVTDALGGVTEYTYDSAHRLKTIKDPRGNVILKNVYDAQGRVVEQRDGLENLWTLEYKEGETVVTEPEGGEITYGFDSQMRTVSEKDQLGHTSTTSYDAAGNIDEIVKPGGAVWTFGYDGAGNLTSVVDPEEGERSYAYDGLNRLTSFTDERGEAWTYEWDGDNDLVKVTDPAEGETTFTHDAAGLPLTITDPNEHTTAFTYDGRGNRLSAKDPLAHTTAFTYNTRNQLTSKTAPGLEPEIYGRNALAELISVTTPEGNKTEYSYDGNGMLTQVKDPASGLWKVERNAMERPTAFVDPLEGRTEIDYDGNLNRIALTDRRGKETTYGYDLANQLTEVVAPEGGDWEFDYDARGNRDEMVEPRENATIYEYDLLDRMTAVEEPLETKTSYGYDAAGNLTSFTDPRENTTSFEYDELGRITEIAQSLEKTTSFTYDGVGNRLTRNTGEGTLSFSYDAADRLQQIVDGETVLRDFGYDAANRMTGALDAQGDEIEVGYDDDGRVESIDDDRGQTVSRAYDSRGNLVKQIDGRGTLTYGYDSLNRMTSLIDPQSKVSEFGYDAEGNLTSVELPNGVTTTKVYDDGGRVAAITSLDPEEAILESLEYDYDPYGNRIGQVNRLSLETTYDYDALNRLTQFDPPGEGSTSYGYDAAGNRTEADGVTYGFNALNQLTSASDGRTYDYDAAGRLIEVDSGEQATTYGWSPLDELEDIDDGTQPVTYTFDALGRQASRDDGSAIRLSHYGDLSDLPIVDTDGEGQPIMSYVQGPEGLMEQRSGEATSFPLSDAHGDITAVLDGAGEVSSRQTFDPWGAQLGGPGLEMGWLGAQQRRADPATGLVQMGARSYAPELGGFLAEDPVLGHIGLGITTNRYPYAWDNPMNLYDLDGRDVCVLGACVGPDDLVTVGEEFEGGLGIAEEGVDAATSSAGSAADGAWDWTAPGRGWVADRSRDFWKKQGDRLESIYNFAGAHWQECREGAKSGAPGGAVVGAFFGPEGIPVGGAVGGGAGCVGATGAAILLE
ncbi:MAG TPA: right-handed parallel beta-helix repeat-containing protein [Solirubrobacterales bacterium]|nr:right-handed parallel beta-helix repeat-containing protein [Solirubrobacterales bacterium]